jgi:hypothetical protein
MSEQTQGAPGLVHIPGHLLPIRLSQIGLSRRLQNALRSLGKSFVGDLHGLSANGLIALDPRGAELMAELVDALQTLAALAQSLNSSSTDPPDVSHHVTPSYRTPPHASRITDHASSTTYHASSSVIRFPCLEIPDDPLPVPPNVAHLLPTLETRLSRLTPRDLKIIELRFGANQQPPATLHHIAFALQLTAEGVRHILDQRIRTLREFSGPEFSQLLAAISTFCREHNLTITPELAAHLLKSLNPQLSSLNLKYDLSFYLRLLSELNANLSTWPSAKTLH